MDNLLGSRLIKQLNKSLTRLNQNTWFNQTTQTEVNKRRLQQWLAKNPIAESCIKHIAFIAPAGKVYTNINDKFIQVLPLGMKVKNDPSTYLMPNPFI